MVFSVFERWGRVDDDSAWSVWGGRGGEVVDGWMGGWMGLLDDDAIMRGRKGGDREGEGGKGAERG